LTATRRNATLPRVRASAPNGGAVNESRTTPAVGAVAPALSLPSDDGGTFDLATQKGHYVVVVFYPRDDTPGCTTEACDLRDRWAQFCALGCAVVGVSSDNAARHLKFRAKYALPHVLATDDDHATLERWGAWGEKKFLGRTSVGVLRSTYLIAPDGTVAAAWPKVRVKGHIDDVLAALQGAAAGQIA
jgi:thioredoxin-dependent peroxiredoxin